jgi:hypothetical protein
MRNRKGWSAWNTFGGGGLVFKEVKTPREGRREGGNVREHRRGLLAWQTAWYVVASDHPRLSPKRS